MSNETRTVRSVPVAQIDPHPSNPRGQIADVDDLVASIKEHGIEVPVVLAPAPDSEDRWVVLAGHRRLCAAKELGLAEVPALFREDVVEEREQLAYMALENLQREQLSITEEVSLLQGMLDLGWSRHEIAKRTGFKRDRVKERLAIGQLPESSTAKIAKGQVSIEEAIAMAEYSDDEVSLRRLEDMAGTTGFDWALSQAKARRDAQKLRAAETTRLKKEGVRVITDLSTFTELRDHEGCEAYCAVWSETANMMLYGCDDDSLHTENAPAPSSTPPARPVGPLDHFTAEQISAAAVFRRGQIAAALRRDDLDDLASDWSREALTQSLSSRSIANPTAAPRYRELLGVPEGADVERFLKKLSLAQLVMAKKVIDSSWPEERLEQHPPDVSAWTAASDRTHRYTELREELGVEPSEVEREIAAALGMEES